MADQESATFTHEQRERLEWLEINGRLTPDRVVEDARAESSPLHTLFNWDVKQAAESYWRETARRVIKRVLVVVTDEVTQVVTPVNQYVRDPSRPAHEQGYITTRTLAKDPAASREAVLAEFARARSALVRAQRIAHALGFADDIEYSITSVVGLAAQVKEEPGEAAAEH